MTSVIHCQKKTVCSNLCLHLCHCQASVSYWRKLWLAIHISAYNIQTHFSQYYMLYNVHSCCVVALQSDSGDVIWSLYRKGDSNYRTVHPNSINLALFDYLLHQIQFVRDHTKEIRVLAFMTQYGIFDHICRIYGLGLAWGDKGCYKYAP